MKKLLFFLFAFLASIGLANAEQVTISWGLVEDLSGTSTSPKITLSEVTYGSNLYIAKTANIGKSYTEGSGTLFSPTTAGNDASPLSDGSQTLIFDFYIPEGYTFNPISFSFFSAKDGSDNDHFLDIYLNNDAPFVSKYVMGRGSNTGTKSKNAETSSVGLTDIELSGSNTLKIDLYGKPKNNTAGWTIGHVEIIGELVNLGDNRENAKISWNVPSTTLKVRDAFTAPIFSNPDNVPVTFSSSNEEVATVDNTGNVALAGGLGTAMISATYDGEAEGAQYQSTTANTTIEVLTNVTDVNAQAEYEKVESIPLTKLYTVDKTEGSLAAGNLIDDDNITIKTVYSANYSTYGKEYLGNNFAGSVQLGRVKSAPSADNLYGTEESKNSPIIITPNIDCKVVMFLRRQTLEQTDLATEDDDVANNVITKTHYMGMSPNDGKSVYAVAHSDINTKIDQNLVFGTYDGAKTDYLWCAVEWDLKAGETYTIWATGTTIAMNGIGYYTDYVEAPEDPWVAEYPHTWDFTKWSDATVANLKAGFNWSDIETAAATEPTEASKDNCFWQVSASKDLSPNKNVRANRTTIEELAGLTYLNTNDRSLAIAVNYTEPNAAGGFGPYHGASYLWLGNGNNQDYFTIPGVPAGATIKMGVESHKLTDANGRGVKLYVGDTELLSPNGETVAYPTEYKELEWVVPTSAAEINDVKVSRNNGCHLYFITVTPPERTLPNISWNTTLTRLKVNGTFTAPELVNPENLAVSFSSSNEDVAIVDTATGEISLVEGGVGTAIITATFDGDASYVPHSVSTTIEVVSLPNNNYGLATLASPSVYPANKASMLPLDGSIKLTFDSDVNVAEGEAFQASLNDTKVTLTADGKDVRVSYSGLQPLTEYTLTIPAGAIGNEESQIMEDLAYTFTTRQADVLFFSDFNVYPEDFFNQFGNLSGNNEFIKTGSTDVTVEVGGMTFYSGTKGRMLAMPGLFDADSSKDYGPYDAVEDAGATKQAVQMIGGTGQYVEFPEMEGPIDVTLWLGNPETSGGTVILKDEVDNTLASFTLPAAKKIKKFTYTYPYSGKVKFRLYNNGKKVDINDALFVKGAGEGIEKPTTPLGWMVIPGELDITHSSWKYVGSASNFGVETKNTPVNVGNIHKNDTATGEMYVTEAGVYSMNIDFYWFKNACDFQIEITDQATGTKEIDTYYHISGIHDANILLEGNLTEGKKTIKYTFHSESDGYLVNYRNQTFTKVGETYAALKAITAEGLDTAETEGYDYSFNIAKDYVGETVTLKAELINAGLSVKVGEEEIQVSEDGEFTLPVPEPNHSSKAILTLNLGEGAYAGQEEFKLRLYHIGEVILSGLTFDGLVADEETVASIQSSKNGMTIDKYIFTTLPTVKATFQDGYEAEATATVTEDKSSATYTFQGIAGEETEDYSFTLENLHIYQTAENDKTDELRFDSQYVDKGGEGIWSNGLYTITSNSGWGGRQFKMRGNSSVTLNVPLYAKVKQIKMACIADNYQPGKVASVISEGAKVYVPSASEFQKYVTDNESPDLIINVEDHVTGSPFVITFEGGSQPLAWFEFIYEPFIVDVDEITLRNTSMRMDDKPMDLEAIVAPANATFRTLWESSDPEIATVDVNGKVTALKIGKTTITATAGDQKAECTVKVYPRLGDADWNGEIRIADAVDISNYVVGKKEADSSWEHAKEWEEFYLAGANANGEGEITFADASAAAELALSEPKSETEEPTEESTQARIAAYAEDADALVIRSSANGNFAVALDNTEAYVALQADIILPEGCNVDVKAAGRAAGSHSMLTRKHADNHIRVIFFNLSNTAFTDSDAPMFEIMTDSNISAEDIVITNIYASDADANESVLASKIGQTSGVAAIGLDENEPVKVYDLSGIYVGDSLEGLQQGTYIVRQGDAARKLRVR